MSSRISSLLALFLILTPLVMYARQESLGEASRKAREQKKHAPKAKKIFTNDNLPADSDSISIVGPAPPAKTARDQQGETNAKQPGASQEKPKKDEAYWRSAFAQAREKLQLAQKELDVLQRELNLLEMQYYSDPNEALRQQYSRKDINEKRQRIEEKQEEVQALQQGLSDLTDELRRSGGDPGWAEPK